MAKQNELNRIIPTGGSSTAPASPPQGGSGMLPPPATQSSTPAALSESPEAELLRLREENMRLRQRLAQDGPQLSNVAGPRQKYRVRLPAIRHADGRVSYVPVRPTAWVVSPRKPVAGQPAIPEKFRSLPPLRLSALEHLAGDNMGTLDASTAAWQRYAETHELDVDGDREFFKVRADIGPVQDYLDVEAVSPADAFQTYRRYCGIVATIQAPEVETLTGLHERPAKVSTAVVA